MRFTTLFVASSLLFGLGASRPASADEAQAQHVVVICVDGLPAYLFEDSNASMPAIRNLAARGVRAAGMIVSNPSVTWPNHTSLTTGVRPEKHGVLFNGVLVRGGVGMPVRVDGRKDKSDLVHGTTIYDVLHAKGMTTAAINWPCTRNAASVDDNFPDVPDALQFTTPRLIAELKAQGMLTDEQIQNFAKLGPVVRDQIWTQATCHVIRTRKPNLVLFHPLIVDGVHHRYGPQSIPGYTAVAYADSLVRDVLEAIDDAGIRERTSVFLVSDHGFMSIPKTLRPNVLLRQAGLLTVENGQIRTAKAQVVPEGGIGMLYLTLPGDRETRQKVIDLFQDREGVSGLILPEEFPKYGLPQPDVYPQMADLIVVAKDGYGVGAEATGDEFVVTSDTTVGAHGFLSTNPKMNATFIASGAGIRQGARIDVIENIDVAPTIARLLGVSLPADGKVVSQLLTND